DPPASHEADKLAALLGAVSAADVANAQSAFGLVALLLGSMLDRSFTAPSSSAAAGFITQAMPPLASKPTLALAVPGGLNGSLAFDIGPPSAIKASLDLAFNRSQPVGGTSLVLAFNGSAGVDVLVPVAPPSGVAVSGNYAIGLELKRKGNALSIGGDALGATLSVGAACCSSSTSAAARRSRSSSSRRTASACRSTRASSRAAAICRSTRTAMPASSS